MASLLSNNDVEANDVSSLGGNCHPLTTTVYAPTAVLINNEKDSGSTSSVHRYPTPPGSATAEKSVPQTEIKNETIALTPILGSVFENDSPIDLCVEEPSSSNRYYAGDVVLMKENNMSNDWMPQFGTVLKPAQGSDMDKSPDKGSNTEFHVHWDFSNRISLEKASSVSLVDRVLLRGQRVQNSNGDVGTVVDSNIAASVIIHGTNCVVERVPLNRLNPITPFVRGQEILYRNWVGVVVGIKRNVWFRLDGGLNFYMEVSESDGFTRVDPYWGLGVTCPGMRIRLPHSTFKKVNWISKPVRFLSRWLPLHYYFAWQISTVTKSEVTEIEVKWIQPAPGAPENIQKPSSTLSSKELDVILIIGTPSTETIGINSVRKLRISSEDNLSKFEAWLGKFRKYFVDGEEENQTMNLDHDLRAFMSRNENVEFPVKVLLRHNTITVKWDNGLIEEVPAIKIPKVSLTVDDGEFPMGLTVASVEKNASAGDKYGIVMSSIELARARTRKVNVRWIVDGIDKGIEAVSVFDLRPHDAYSLYTRGTILFPRTGASSQPPFVSGYVVDLNVNAGRMVVKLSTDNSQHEVYPHQVTALEKRCHWSFFTRTWVIDDLVPPPYQLELEFSPIGKLVDVADQKWDLLTQYEVDPNNPGQQQQTNSNKASTSSPSINTTNNTGDEECSIPTIWDEASFELLAFAPLTHRYYNCPKGKTFGKGFAQKIEKEMVAIKEKGVIPEGIWLRCYENRLDLLSVLMVGPTKTPYEDGLFLFDVQLPADFPESLPSVHYVSYTHELHPLLSFDGNVCVHLLQLDHVELGQSHIAHFLGKLQALIFTPTPYFSHPNKKFEEDTEHGLIKAQLYNQNVFVRVLDSLWNMLQNPHSPWEKSIRNHFASTMPEKFFGVEKWICSEEGPEHVVVHDPTADSPCSGAEDDVPSYPLFPISEGMRLSVQKRIQRFKKLSNQLPIVEINSVTDATADSESFAVKKTNLKEESPAAVVVTVTAPATSAPTPSTTDAARMLTPIAEITEPSSTSTFGTKLSNITVPSDTEDMNLPSSNHQHNDSLDSLKNVKVHEAGEKSKQGNDQLSPDDCATSATGNNEQSKKENNSNVPVISAD